MVSILEMFSNNATAFNTIKKQKHLISMLALFSCNHIQAYSLTHSLTHFVCTSLSRYVGASVFSKTAKLFVIVSETASAYLTIPEFRCKVNIIMIWSNEKRMPEKQQKHQKQL